MTTIERFMSREPDLGDRGSIANMACAFGPALLFAPSFIASELKLAGNAPGQMTINFVLEDGHRNVGDARRLFNLFKADTLPEWQHLLAILT
jgi:hypothetical protein